MTGAKNKSRLANSIAETLALHRAGRLAEAMVRYDRLIAGNPHLADLHNNRGIALAQLGRTEEALASYGLALGLNPHDADALTNQGIVLGVLNRFSEAIACFDRALALRPDHALARRYRAAAGAAHARPQPEATPAMALVETGITRASAGDLAGAVAAFSAAIELDPINAIAHGNRGTALNDLGRQEEALADFDRAINLDPGIAAFHHNLGNALCAAGRHVDAIAAYNRALELDPADAETHFRRGEGLVALARPSDALASYQKALSAEPRSAKIRWACARTLMELGDAARALANAEAAIGLDPKHGGAHNICGLALTALGRRNEALASFDQALAINPEDAAALNNRGELLQALGNIEAAIADLSKALALSPDLSFISGQLLHYRMRLSDWTDFNVQRDSLKAEIADGSAHSSPFALLSLVDEPDLHRIAAKSYLARRCLTTSPPVPAHPRANKIKVGYFSADFFAHATMYLMADLLVEHNRDRFEIFAFSYGPDQPDPWRERAERSCDRFIDVRQSSDEGIAALARSMAVDIAVDLKGMTGGSRHGIFAARAAPLQLSFLGYPGTMPAPFIDYLVADHMVIPAEQRASYAEKIIFLPDSYQPNCSVPDVDKINASRREEGLPEGRFVYCCFNQNYKITPERFDTWMNILKAANDSVLWLWADEAGARHNLRKEAAARGVSQDRLIFVSIADREAHLARLRIADLFLDTGPYGAHTTASDALRVGLPVLTHPGRSFASRVAASLLQAVEMPELICNSNDQYFSRAVALAQSPDELRIIRETLRDKRFTAPLFRPDRFARNIEQGYMAAYERSQLGLAPDDLNVVGD